ncbi:flavin reductase [Rhodococcus sp. RDE2]|uniref:flavin reductase n=1 Tax=unclassified Rhodococcus (in: high G+C Gram-positive bacteria) TaxID=192944 RepID=UPI001E4DF49B|nr:flavin reductase [Rhodococcus sp. RDE2]BDB59722.1 flavin reductase [Rhodococcus sp. RDE2]
MQIHGTIDPARFRQTLGHYPTGVAVITAIDADGQPVGMVVGSFTSVSLDPPIVAYLPTRESRTYARLRTSSHFCVNVLAADQRELCGRFAARGDDKFAGVEWTPAPSGSPILDGAVTWIDCEVADELEGGDHFIVMGRVQDLDVARPTLPLLFFQGGYGRFSLPTSVAPADPELIRGVRMAEAARGGLEALAAGVGADCGVLARVGDEAVFVMTENHSGDPDAVEIGQRIPLIPPLGTVFHSQASDDEVQQWLGRAGRNDDTAAFVSNLEKVRDRGYSMSLMPETELARVSVMNDYSGCDVLPEHDRRMKQMISGTASLYEPDIDPDGTYDLHSVVVPVPDPEGRTRIALRLSRLPRAASGDQVLRWIDDLRSVAAGTAEALAARTPSTKEK